jgi:(4S)-4-hydroxy-5-phosphonooxypentane-2,3-dione isomerase
MHVILVRLKIKPEHVADFEREIAHHAAATRRTEPGCLQFDVCVDKSDPTTFYFYEVYRDDAAMEAHKASPTLKAMGTKMPGWVLERERHDALRREMAQ